MVNVRRWMTTTDHKDIGIMYILASLLFGLIGGLLAELLRAQTRGPGLSFISPEFYNQAVTLHGLVMVLWFASPLSVGIANYLVPIKIGARDLAFPRLNALSFWLFFFGGLVAASGLFMPEGAIDTGWTVYAPLSTAEFSPTVGVLLGVAGLAMLIASMILGTINFLTTIALYRTEGMTLMRMPMFVWFWLATMLIALYIFPVIGAGGLMLFSDRVIGTVFFQDPYGTLLWGNYFWIFGHPEVYVLLLPALGVMAEVIESFARRPIWGKKIVIANVLIAVAMSMIVWGHHMYITGVGVLWREYMSIMTELISVPFGVITIAFMLTLYKGSVKYKTPMLFAIGGLALFVMIGGPTGVFNSSAALDYQIRGTYWLVAHFHFVLVPAVVMGLIAGIYFWFPKITGRMYGEGLGMLHFAGTTLGVILTYGGMFAIKEAPRRYATYQASTGWGEMQMVSFIGALVLGLSQVVFVLNLGMSLRRGESASDDPWGGHALEWTLSSPPPEHSFDRRPIVTERADSGDSGREMPRPSESDDVSRGGSSPLGSRRYVEDAE